MHHLTKEQQTLVTEHQGMAKQIGVAIACQRGLPPWEIDALVSDAYLALCQLAGTFDPERGIPFRAYFRSRLKNRMIDYARERVGRDRGTGISERQIAVLNPVRVGDWEAEMGSFQPTTYESGYADVEVADSLKRAVEALSPRERDILGKHITGSTHTELAEEYGVSTSRISQLLAKAKKVIAEYDEEAAWSL